MNTGPHLQPSLASLTAEEMSLLPISARLLAVVLTMRAHPSEPTRLSLPQIKQRVFPFDETVTIDSLTLDVLALEEVGFLSTLVGTDGRERYLVSLDVAAAVTPAAEPAQPAHSEHIATVGREGEQRASEGARAVPPRRSSYRKPPPRFCPEHAPTNGSGGESCVECRDARMEWTTWHFEVTHGIDPDDDPPVVPRPTPSPRSAPSASARGGRRPRFRPADALDDPNLPGYLPDDEIPF
ncbi:hypothetical protein [Microbacterium halophytorum]|uniref:hypothetical protein n=1 Tax=Microbacterium halophytorum TaxID=2067568 RepID=UPI000CFDE3B7|nr:hypothetical protein [Microbacterium halophytorum]